MNTAPLIIVVGLFFLLMGTVGNTLLRTSSTPLISKLAIMVLLAAIPCTLVWALPYAYGYPVETTFEAMPDRVELLGFLPYDNETHVYLWLREGNFPPRAYSVAMPDEFKETLRKAKEELSKNGHAELVKHKGDEAKNANNNKGKDGKPGTDHHPYIGIDGGEAPYELSPEAFSLPLKEDK